MFYVKIRIRFVAGPGEKAHLPGEPAIHDIVVFENLIQRPFPHIIVDAQHRGDNSRFPATGFSQHAAEIHRHVALCFNNTRRRDVSGHCETSPYDGREERHVGNKTPKVEKAYNALQSEPLQGGMQMDHTMRKLLHAVACQLGVDEKELKPETRIVADLGVDSLDLVELVMAVEETFEIRLPDPVDSPNDIYSGIFTDPDFCIADFVDLLSIRREVEARKFGKPFWSSVVSSMRPSFAAFT